MFCCRLAYSINVCMYVCNVCSTCCVRATLVFGTCSTSQDSFQSAATAVRCDDVVWGLSVELEHATTSDLLYQLTGRTFGRQESLMHLSTEKTRVVYSFVSRSPDGVLVSMSYHSDMSTTVLPARCRIAGHVERRSRSLHLAVWPIANLILSTSETSQNTTHITVAC